MAAERVYERYAWTLPFAVGLAAILTGVFLASLGRPTEGELAAFSSLGVTWEALLLVDPGMAEYISELTVFIGSAYATIGVLVAAISATAFRRGERWAWAALLVLPVLFVVVILEDATSSFPHIWPFYAGYLAIVLLGLILPVRKFFPEGVR